MEYGQGYRPYGPSDREKALLIQLLLKRKQQEAQQSQSASGGTDTLLKAAIGGGAASTLLPGATAATEAVQSIQPAMTLADINSISNGGAGLMSVDTNVPLARSFAQTPEAGLGAAPYLGAASALAGGYTLGKGINASDRKTSGLGGAMLGGGLAAAAPLLGFTPLGAGAIALSALGGGGLGALAGHIKGGKSQVQQQRDAGRKAGQSSGFIDNDYQVTLADGSKFDVGKDGGASYENMGKNIDGRTSRHAYDVDFSNPLSGGTVAKVDPYVKKILGEGASQKQISDLTGQFVNAILSNAKTQQEADANIGSIFKGQRPSQSKPTQPQSFNKEPLKVNPAVANKVLPKLMIPRSGARGN